MNLLGLRPEDAVSTFPELRLAEARSVLGALISDGAGSPLPRRGLRRAAADVILAQTWERPVVVERAETDDGALRLVLESAGDRFDVVRIQLAQPGRFSVCLSSQVGCAMACGFCATGKLGLTRNLSAAEIIGSFLQVRDTLPAGARITGAVFMGQGEPLHNYDEVLRAAQILRDPCGGRIRAESISISTVGLPAAIRRFAAERQPFRLVVSLTSTRPDLRKHWLPVAGRVPLAELAAALSEVYAVQGDRLTLAWVLLGGVNTDPAEVAGIAEHFGHLPLRINLIDVNDPSLSRASDDERNAFVDALQALRVPVVRRYSVGQAQNAACGMLAALTEATC